MLKKFFVASLIVAMSSACVSCTSAPNTGGVVGAGTGALVGTAVSGSFAGALAGAAIGGIIGNAIGSELDARDKTYLENNINVALDSAYKHKYHKWHNTITGTSGEIVLVRAYKDKHNHNCGDFADYMHVNGQKYKASFRACKHGSDKWVIHK